MDNSLEQIAKEALKGNQTQAKVVLIALAVYEIAVLSKKAWDLAKGLKL